MSVLDQIYSAPAQVSHAFLGGLLVFVGAISGVFLGIYRARKKK